VEHSLQPEGPGSHAAATFGTLAMPTREHADANFFALVHHVLEATRKEDEPERRETRRRKFSCLQFIAPYTDGRLPSESDFERVVCLDLSPTGFSFLIKRLPECQHLVAALRGNSMIYVTAEVIRQQEFTHEDRHMWRIGCHFLSRISIPRLNANLFGKGPT
jgi:hypothetical protein